MTDYRVDPGLITLHVKVHIAVTAEGLFHITVSLLKRSADIDIENIALRICVFLHENIEFVDLGIRKVLYILGASSGCCRLDIYDHTGICFLYSLNIGFVLLSYRRSRSSHKIVGTHHDKRILRSALLDQLFCLHLSTFIFQHVAVKFCLVRIEGIANLCSYQRTSEVILSLGIEIHRKSFRCGVADKHRF